MHNEKYDVYEMADDKTKNDILVASEVDLETALDLVNEKPFKRIHMPCIINGA